MGVPMNYGPCDGGPWDKKHLAHPEELYIVPFETHSRKIHVGVRPGKPGYEFGEYRFEAGTWHWTSAASVASRGAAKIV
jgi:hypothetical protein